MTPDGKVSSLTDGRGGKPGGKGASPKFGGVTGMACSPDGSLYVTDGRSLRKITLDGTVSTRVGEIVVKECAHGEGAQVPFVRGLAVDPRGAVYGAATGCRCVIKITPDGSVTTVLKAERPWAPIGVAVRDGDLYVLEHNNPAAEGPRDGVPRVRKMGRDGKVITLATVSREKEPAQR
jgi:sugar lactone lactonase YvrE